MLLSKRYFLTVAVVVLIPIVVWLFFFKTSAILAASDRTSQNDQAVGELPKDNSQTVVHLYFSNKENSFLFSEERTILYAEDPAKFGQTIIEALIAGPREGLMRTIPATTGLRALYVTQDGTAYVDMAAAIKDAHPGGIYSEQMTIFSIVNSLVLNIPKIEAVKILVDGDEATTLAGHMDLRFPFQANMLLIR